MNQRVFDVLSLWALNFPEHKPGHYVFPSELVGMSGHRFQSGTPVYSTTPSKPMGSNKGAWKEAKKVAGWILAGRPEDRDGCPPLACRIHDLRHTASSRMQADVVPLNQIAQLMGWSPSQTVLMARRYGHFNVHQLRDAAESMGARDTTGAMGARGAQGDAKGNDGTNSESRHISRHFPSTISSDSAKLLN